MFNAVLVSLSDGQSYENVQICEDADLDKYDIPRPFEEWTACIFADGACLIVHHWKIKVIHIDRLRRSAPGSTRTDRLILDGDIIYAPATFLHQDHWTEIGVPHFFIKRNGIAGQMAWTNAEGTFITHDTNVTSIIVPDPRPRGITSAEQPNATPTSVQKQNAKPDTIHGQVVKRLG
jgi:hypothetical protein